MQWEWNVPNVASGAVARYEEHTAFPLFDVISSILLERHQTLMTVTEYTGHQRSVAWPSEAGRCGHRSGSTTCVREVVSLPPLLADSNSNTSSLLYQPHSICLDVHHDTAAPPSP